MTNLASEILLLRKFVLGVYELARKQRETAQEYEETEDKDKSCAEIVSSTPTTHHPPTTLYIAVRSG